MNKKNAKPFLFKFVLGLVGFGAISPGLKGIISQIVMVVLD